MKVYPIRKPLTGERVVGVHPTIKPDVELDWHRRVNFYTGRSLSDVALKTEQEGRAGRLAMRGQMVSPGVVNGLEVGLEHEEDGSKVRYFCNVAAGLGITASGEDVVVPKPLRVEVGSLPVYAPAALLEGVEEAEEEESSEVAVAGALQARRLGPTLETLIQDNVPLPPAGILVLQPVVVEVSGEFDPSDPCEVDPQNDAFADWQLVDGCRLVFYAWPNDWQPLPEPGERWRNRIAYTIFEAEKRNGPTQFLPWEALGVPIGLFGFQMEDQVNAVETGTSVGGGFQSFTPSGSALAAVDLRLRAGGSFPDDGYETMVRIRSGAVDGPILGTASTLVAGPPTAGAQREVRFEFTPQISMTPGDTYIIEWVSPPEGPAVLTWMVADGNPYPGGNAFSMGGQVMADRDFIFTTCTPPFLDRYAVVRTGGKPKRRSVLVPDAGNPFLWQARMQQFAEQVAEEILADTPVEQFSQQFRYLPPSGLLPKDAIDPREAQGHFFPSTYHVEAIPMPLEQLDVAMEASASLTPFDTFTPDRVQVLVPVPQIWYEPNLLEVENVDPEFQETIDEFVERRGKWLKRRQDVREIAATIVQAIAGEPPSYPDPDPEALEEEEIAADPLDPEDPELAEPEEAYGTVVEEGERVVKLFEALRAELGDAPLKHETTVSAEAFFSEITFPETLADKIRYDDERGVLIFQGAMTEEERDQLIKLLDKFLGDPTQGRATIERLYQESQKDELSQLDKLGLVRFIDFLEDKVKRADDKIDFGFLRVQTDIYRLRQLMLGTVAASRLATSPTLASIAKGESALTTREDLKTFLKEIKGDGGDNPGEEGGNPSNPDGPDPPEDSVRSTSDLGASISLTSRGSLSGERFLSGEVGLTKTGRDLPVVGGFEAIPGGYVVIEEPRQPTKAELLRRETTGGAIKGIEVPATKEEVVQKSPIVGKAYDFRTMTIAARLEEPPATESKTASVASKYAAIIGLTDLDLTIDDLKVPGFLEEDTEVKKSFADIKAGNLGAEILEGVHDPDPADGDEAAFFSAGVRALDHTVATLRIVEGRIFSYRQAIELCKDTLKELGALVVRVDKRLKVIGDELTEARHDVAVARALLAEEQARVKAINERRDEIVAEHVSFLAFHRPRLSDLLLDTPVRAIDPGLVEAAVPVCLARAVTIPPELRAMVDLLRDVPVKWFTYVPHLLDRLDRLEILHETITSAKSRAQVRYLAKKQPPKAKSYGGLLGQAIGKVFTAQRQVVTQYRLQTAQLDLALFAGQSWKRSRAQAEDTVSLGDLIDAGHGRSDVAQRATRELDNIAHVAACLYSSFGEVLPSIRLDWAERLSQYDAPVNLRNLASLPRWGEIEYLDRREMQTLADWLYQRVDPRQPEAVSMINDLVRICILLASHAPVKQIIAGHVREATTVKVGGLVKLAIDPTKVRVGMPALMYAGSQVVAKAIVEDLSAGQASARVVKAMEETVQLEEGARVQFGEQAAFDTSPLTGGTTGIESNEVSGSFASFGISLW